MSNRLPKEKAALIASNYMTNGLKKVKALLDCGYSTSYANNVGLKLFDNELVKAAISRIEAVNMAQTGWSVAQAQERLLRYADQAETDKQSAAAVSAVVAVNRMHGLDKQTVITERTPDQPEGKEAEVLEGLNREYKLKLSQPDTEAKQA